MKRDLDIDRTRHAGAWDALERFLEAVDEHRIPEQRDTETVAEALRRWLVGAPAEIAFDNHFAGLSDTKRRELYLRSMAAKAVRREVSAGKTRHVARQLVAERMDRSFDYVKKADEEHTPPLTE